MSETDWKSMDEGPDGVFDVLARYYDAGLNSFFIQRFCQCVMVDTQVVWASPFPGERHAVDLVKAGYRPILWRAAPELPEHMRGLVGGPADPVGAPPLNEGKGE